jgi:hypothetical protein
MKINHSILIFLFSCLFFSCILDEKEEDIHYYHRNFFLGETAFLLEGEAMNIKPSLLTRISAGTVHWSLDINNNYNKGWEILSTELSENKFEMSIDVTANGVTLGSEILSEGIITPMGFPEDFPSCYLVFRPKNNSDSYRSINTYTKINEIRYSCTFVYVAEPIDLSGTEVIEILQWQGDNSKVIRNDIHHYDFNFLKSGWYKIIGWHDKPIDNDTGHSSGADIYFYEPDYRD